MYKNNEIDAIFNSIPPDIVNEIKLQKDYYQHKSNAIYLYSFNTKIKPLDDARVREALTLAIDRETLTYKVLNDGTVPTREITPDLENYNYGKNWLYLILKNLKSFWRMQGILMGKDSQC